MAAAARWSAACACLGVSRSEEAVLGHNTGLTPYRGPESAPTLLAATTIPGAGGITAIGPSSSGTAQPVPSRPRRLPSPALQ